MDERLSRGRDELRSRWHRWQTLPYPTAQHPPGSDAGEVNGVDLALEAGDAAAILGDHFSDGRLGDDSRTGLPLTVAALERAVPSLQGPAFTYFAEALDLLRAVMDLEDASSTMRHGQTLADVGSRTSKGRAFRLAALSWVIYALVTPLPVLGYPSLLVPAIIRAGFGLLIAWFFWSRPGRRIAMVGTILSFFFIPLAFLAVTNLPTVGPLYLVLAAAGLLVFVTSAHCLWLTTRWSQRSS